jgi:DNA replication and repair protein RecF
VRLERLEADRLRNLRAVQLDLGTGLTLVTGRNGHGKSSLLEAVYLLGTGRSFRTRKTEELTCWDGGPLRAAGEVEGVRGRSKLTVVIDQGQRRLLADGAERELDRFIGRLDVVDLTSDRMKVLRGGPEERRRFLDRGIVGLGPAYLRVLGEYRRCLHQRNALLRRGVLPGPELEVWDDRLADAAAMLHVKRREYAVRLGSRLGEPTRALFPDDGRLTVVYQPSPSATADAPAAEFHRTYLRALAEGRERDLAVGHTCRGPHRDDVRVELGGIDLRKYGSAGQIRASMVALKLGKLSLLEQDRGDAPLFLMDDFDSDLDEVRASALASFLHGGGFQALVATSKEGIPSRLGVPFQRVLMRDGEALAA